MQQQQSSYDQSLLDSTPKATRSQLQEGYNVDLLEQPPPRRASVRSPLVPAPAPVPAPPPPSQPLETPSREKRASVPVLSVTKPRTSFWRTRNGIIVLVAIILLVIAAVVGGAVGGTAKKSSNNTVHPSSAAPVPTLITVMPPSEVTVVPASTTQTDVGASPTAEGNGQNTGNNGHFRR